MKYIEIIKEAKKYGYKFYKNAKGSHQIWKNDFGDTINIPHHKNKDIPNGTAKSTLKTIKNNYENHNNQSGIKR